MADDIQNVGLRAQIYGASEYLNRIKAVESATARLGQQLQTTARQSSGLNLSSVGSGLSRLLDPLQKVGFAVFGVQQLTMAFQQLGSAVLGPSMAWEGYEMTFTTFLGSVDKARAKLNEFEEFARKTPFTLPTVVDAAKQLMAYGFGIEEVLPMMKKISNASGALGSETFPAIVRALGQMRVTTKVNAQDMLQLTSAGINAWQYVADAIGVSTAEVRKLSEQGVLPAEKAIGAILDGMERQFGGLSEGMAGTLSGMLSNLEDFWFKARRALGKGLFEGSKAVVGGLLDLTENPQTMRTLESWGNAMGELVSQGIKFGRDVLPGITQGISGIKATWESFDSRAQSGLLMMGFLLAAQGPIVGGAQLVASTIRAIGVAAIWSTAKVMGIATGLMLAAATASAVLQEGTHGWDAVTAKIGDNLRAQMKPLQELTNTLAGAATGEPALAEQMNQTLAMEQEVSAIQHEINDAKDEMTRAQERYNAALKGEVYILPGLTRKLEYDQIEKNRVAQAQALADAKSRYDQLMGNKADKEREIANLSKTLGIEAIDAVAGKMGDFASWSKGVLGDVWTSFRQQASMAAADVARAQEQAYSRRTVRGGAVEGAYEVGTGIEQKGAGLLFGGGLARMAQTALEYARAQQQAKEASNDTWNSIIGGADAASGKLSEVEAETRRVEDALRAAEQAMRDFSEPRLPGMQAYEDEIFEVEMAIKRARLAEMGAGSAITQAAEDLGASFDTLSAQQREIEQGIPVALQRYEWEIEQARAKAQSAANSAPSSGGGESESARLEKAREALQLQKDLTYEPKLRQLREMYETATGANDELTFEQALLGLTNSAAQAKALRAQLDPTAVAAQDTAAAYWDQQTASDEVLGTRSAQVGVESQITGLVDAQATAITTATDNYGPLIEKAKEYASVVASTGGYQPSPAVETARINRNLIEGAATGGTITKEGWITVGERGPEPVYLPRGSTVLPHEYVTNKSSKTWNDTYNIYGANQPVRVGDEIRKLRLLDKLTRGRN